MTEPSDRPERSGTAHPAGFGVRDPRSALRAAACSTIGLVVGGGLSVAGLGAIAPVGGWVAGVTVFLVWVWASLWHADAPRTAALAVREDISGPVTDVLLLLAAVASLVGVGDMIMLGAHRGDQVGPDLAIALAIGSVVMSWALVHTIFTLRYARLYYRGPDGGIAFNQDQPPRYSDFAYLAFTIGMTFQVSDTDLKGSDIRGTALRHAMLSYVFGTVIIAVTINLVAGLAKP